MNFKTWLAGQAHRQDSVGQLARYVRDDECLPDSVTGILSIMSHVFTHNDVQGLMRGQAKSEQEYREYERGTK